MAKSWLESAANLFTVSQQGRQNKEDIRDVRSDITALRKEVREVRDELQNVHVLMKAFLSELKVQRAEMDHMKANEAQARQLIELKLENRLLQLPRPKTPPRPAN